MERRHPYNSSQNNDPDNDQAWNHPEQPYMHLARSSVPEVNTSIYPVDNLVLESGNFTSHQWNNHNHHHNHPVPGPRSSVYLPPPTPPNNNVQLPHFQPHTHGHGPPSHHHFPIVQENYSHHPHPSSSSNQTFHAATTSRGSSSSSYKRKTYDVGSSSTMPPIDSWHEKHLSDSSSSSSTSHQTPWEFPPTFNNPSHNLNIDDINNNNTRNVRSRPSFTDHSSNNDLWAQNSAEWNNNSIGHGRPIISSNTTTQSVRGLRTGYTQRSVSVTPSYIASSSSNLRPIHTVTPPSDEGLQVISDRYSRPYSTVVFRDRSVRSRISNDRYRPFSDEMILPDRPSPEGLMIAERSVLHVSRSMFDQHRDMRLDIDNMSYEELLALEERMGNVNTGLSDEVINNCLNQTIFCSSDQCQQGKCVICLEEYKKMESIGCLKECRHDFHVECIRKWLSMKSVCPICKACVLDDKMKHK